MTPETFILNANLVEEHKYNLRLITIIRLNCPNFGGVESLERNENLVKYGKLAAIH
jgi:hypothetical protein